MKQKGREPRRRLASGFPERSRLGAVGTAVPSRRAVEVLLAAAHAALGPPVRSYLPVEHPATRSVAVP